MALFCLPFWATVVLGLTSLSRSALARPAGPPVPGRDRGNGDDNDDVSSLLQVATTSTEQRSGKQSSQQFLDWKINQAQVSAQISGSQFHKHGQELNELMRIASALHRTLDGVTEAAKLLSSRASNAQDSEGFESDVRPALESVQAKLSVLMKGWASHRSAVADVLVSLGDELAAGITLSDSKDKLKKSLSATVLNTQCMESGMTSFQEWYTSLGVKGLNPNSKQIIGRKLSAVRRCMDTDTMPIGRGTSNGMNLLEKSDTILGPAVVNDEVEDAQDHETMAVVVVSMHILQRAALKAMEKLSAAAGGVIEQYTWIYSGPS